MTAQQGGRIDTKNIFKQAFFWSSFRFTEELSGR